MDKIIYKSNLSKRLETTKLIEQFDSCAKKLLSEKIILAWILKSCVEEFKDCSSLIIKNRKVYSIWVIMNTDKERRGE